MNVRYHCYYEKFVKDDVFMWYKDLTVKHIVTELKNSEMRAKEIASNGRKKHHRILNIGRSRNENIHSSISKY